MNELSPNADTVFGLLYTIGALTAAQIECYLRKRRKVNSAVRWVNSALKELIAHGCIAHNKVKDTYYVVGDSDTTTRTNAFYIILDYLDTANGIVVLNTPYDFKFSSEMGKTVYIATCKAGNEYITAKLLDSAPRQPDSLLMLIIDVKSQLTNLELPKADYYVITSPKQIDYIEGGITHE